jgi:predicted nucleic acid-binding protein
MPAVILDACGTINLYATGRFVPLLTELKRDWYLPAGALRETKYIRQPDPEDSSKLIPVAIDLEPALAAGVLKVCSCQDDAELDLYVELVAQIRDDGESLGLAIAKCRGWHIVTDDRKARRIAGELGVTVVSTPELIKAWAVTTAASSQEIARVLQNVHTFARFTPNSSLPEHDWWMDAVSRLPE